jgi:hypothetical protein
MLYSKITSNRNYNNFSVSVRLSLVPNIKLKLKVNTSILLENSYFYYTQTTNTVDKQSLLCIPIPILFEAKLTCKSSYFE